MLFQGNILDFSSSQTYLFSLEMSSECKNGKWTSTRCSWENAWDVKHSTEEEKCRVSRNFYFRDRIHNLVRTTVIGSSSHFHLLSSTPVVNPEIWVQPSSPSTASWSFLVSRWNPHCRGPIMPRAPQKKSSSWDSKLSFKKYCLCYQLTTSLPPLLSWHNRPYHEFINFELLNLTKGCRMLALTGRAFHPAQWHVGWVKPTASF